MNIRQRIDTKKLLILSILLNILTIFMYGFMFDDTTIVQVEKVPDVKLVLFDKQDNAPIAKIEEPKVLTQREIINNYVKQIHQFYPNVEVELVESVIQHESEYTPKHKTGDCDGLMQISSRWHMDRMKRLGVTDLFDPYSNILVGTDYLSELLTKYKDPKLALMLYNMKHDTAFALYSKGITSDYAKSVLAMAEDLKKGE